MAADKKLFCSRPFRRFEVSHMKGGGAVYMCCSSWLNRPIGDLKKQSVNEIWNGPEAREIRESIHDGSFRYCDKSRCPFLQTVSGPVQRAEDVKDADLRAEMERRLVALPHGPREINCAFDRSCNLSCPSCRTKVIVETANEERIMSLQRKLRREALRSAQFISITGSGDPFGSPYFKRWLQTMDPAEMPELRGIHLHTNAQLWTPAMWASLPEPVRAGIKSAEISIDAATAATYAINRRGGGFERLLENLGFIRTLRADGPLRWVCISMVVQDNNFAEMPDFVRLGKRCGFDRVYFSQLVNWGTFPDEEFRARAVHVPGHPRHDRLVSTLKDPAFADPAVLLGNLNGLRGPAAAARG